MTTATFKNTTSLNPHNVHSPNASKAKGVYLQFVNFQEIMDLLTTPPIFVNDIDTSTIAGRERLDNLVRTNYNGDSLSILPSCDCGSLTGEYLRNTRCGNCNTLVTSVTEKPIESTIWIRTPEGVRSLMNPMFWTILNNAFTSSGLSLLQWICLPSYPVPNDRHGSIQKLQGLGISRGWNYFVDNFDEIFNVLLTNFLKPNDPLRNELRLLVTLNRHLIFTPYLPVPNRLAFITERTTVGTYADSTIKSAIDAVRTICNVDETYGGTTQLVRENRTVKTIMQLADYYQDQHKTVIGKKEGWFRKHIFGTLSTYTGRCVISSLSAAHDYEELHTPWSYTISLLSIHLKGKLMRLGFTPKEAGKRLILASNQYDELIDQLMQELIDESPFKGIPVIFQRNPSLDRLSAQAFYITYVKKDPNINTVSISTMVLKGPNADFDSSSLSLLSVMIVDLFPNCWNPLKLRLLQRNSKGKRECERKLERKSEMTYAEVKATLAA